MAQTRAQRAAQDRRHLPGDQVQKRGASMPRPPPRKTHHPSPPGQPTSVHGRCRKRANEDTHDPAPRPPPKRLRAAVGDTFTAGDNRDPNYPIEFWVREGSWPHDYIQPDMEHALARQRSSNSLRRKRSDSATSTTPSDQRAREEKSAPYRDPRYETLLNTKGTYMETSELGVADESKLICRNLLQGEQSIPPGSIFDSTVFERACNNLQKANEARVIQDISRLLVPSAETLALYTKPLKLLKESVNEGWNNSIPLTGTRPQPDYSVGFRREAFTEGQLTKLSPFIGDFIRGDLSFFMATYYMYFPFLACEVKCGAAALDIADRQNAHSMTLAARGVVELFRLVKREDEVHRQILAWSVSHDHRSVRIYGYYAVIDGKDTKYYRHPVRTFDFTELNGKEKWAAYRFTRNVYDTWMPDHFKRMSSAIDQLPLKLDFDVSALSESTSLSQGLENHHLTPSEADSASLLADDDDQSAHAAQIATPPTSFSKPAPAKRRKSPVKRP
ncbi:hypothetical protein MY10362_009851 [Beauveria mimosiformis]